MSEKYNIPEENSLDSMEGVENISKPNPYSNMENLEPSPEVKEMIKEKVKDVLEFGTAFHMSGRPDVLFTDNTNGQYTFNDPDHHEFHDRKGKQTELSPETIRDYFSLGKKMSKKIGDIFKYGIQGGTAVGGLATDAESYKKKIDLIEQKGSGQHDIRPMVYFSILGRGASTLSEPKGWFGGMSYVFEPPANEVLSIAHSEDLSVKNTGPLKFGEYRISNDTNNISPLEQVIRKYPDLKINDSRLVSLSDEEYEEKKNEFSRFNRGFTKEGYTKTSVNEGFVSLLRIAPRKLTGIVVDWTPDSYWQKSVLIEDVLESNEKIEDIMDNELYQRAISFYEKLISKDEVTVNKHVTNLRKKVISEMIESCRDNPQNMIPVYDLKGNLVWPENLPHDEIAKIKKRDSAREGSI